MTVSTRPGEAAAAACGAIVLWSLNAAAGGAVLAHLSVLQVLALQFGGAFATLLGARRVSGHPVWLSTLLRPQTLRTGVVGLAGTIALQYVAFATAPLLVGNVIAYAWPLLAVVCTPLAPGGRRQRLLLTIVGFGGVVLLFTARGGDGSSGSAPLLGYAAALGSAIAMAGYTVSAGPTNAPAGDLLLAGAGAGALATLPAALAVSEDSAIAASNSSRPNSSRVASARRNSTLGHLRSATRAVARASRRADRPPAPPMYVLAGVRTCRCARRGHVAAQDAR